MKERGLKTAKFVFIFGLIFISFFIFVPRVSAEISFSQTEDVYNIGDTVFLDVSVIPDSPTNSFLDVKLICGGDETDVFRAPYSLDAGEEKVALIDLALGRGVIGETTGSCFFKADYGGETQESQSFDISNYIDIEANTNKQTYDPGEKVSVSGTAYLETGEAVEGFVEADVGSSGLTITDKVKDGKFNFDIELPTNFKSGESDLIIRVYEEDLAGEVTNDATITDRFEVREVLSGIQIFLNTQDVIPGEQNLTYYVEAYDQADNKIERDVNVKIYSSDDSIFSQKNIGSLNDEELETESNFRSGYWEIRASVDSFEESKLFYVEERPLISFEIENQTLVVNNIGNVRYTNPIEISIGEEKFTKTLDLKVGETKKFKLSAPENSYNVMVKGGESEFSADGVLLTGRAVGVGNSGGALTKISLMGFLILILVIVIIIVWWYRKRKGSFFSKKTKDISNNYFKDTKKIINSSPAVEPVMGGRKEEAAVVSIRLDDFAGDSEPVVEHALLLAKDAGAKVYINGEFRIMIFSPSLTKQQDNNTLAVKTANRIKNDFLAYNKRSRGKIGFGIGVSEGQVVIENHGGHTKLTSLGNLISAAKKISSIAKGELLVSEKIHGRLSGEIKTSSVSGLNVWKVREVVERRGNVFTERFGNSS